MKLQVKISFGKFYFKNFAIIKKIKFLKLIAQA